MAIPLARLAAFGNLELLFGLAHALLEPCQPLLVVLGVRRPCAAALLPDPLDVAVAGIVARGLQCLACGFDFLARSFDRARTSGSGRRATRALGRWAGARLWHGSGIRVGIDVHADHLAVEVLGR